MEQPVNNTRTESGELRWVLLESNGQQPSVMFGHSAVVWKDSMYVFAGYSFGYLRDLFQFDFGESNIFTKINKPHILPLINILR